MLENDTRDVHATRRYDCDGNIVRRLRTFIFDSFLSNPANGRTLTYAQHNNDNEDLAVPGDLDSIT